MDAWWTIRGLAHALGVEWGWGYQRMRHGFLRAPEVRRRPPYGHVLLRDAAA